MVDVSLKIDTKRMAIAQGEVVLNPKTIRLIKKDRIPKGDVLVAAKLAGIMAAKRTAEMIPLCHPLVITAADIDFQFSGKNKIRIKSRICCIGKTGVEMEALAAVSLAALTIYDMCKTIDKGMVISDIRLLKKTGGKSGKYERYN